MLSQTVRSLTAQSINGSGYIEPRDAMLKIQFQKDKIT